MTVKELTYLSFHSIVWVIFLLVFVYMFTHVWTRKGYEGIDGKLDLQEVDKFVAHVISAVSFLALYAQEMWVILMQFHVSAEWKYIVAGGFLGSGLYIVFGSIIKKKLADQHEKAKS